MADTPAPPTPIPPQVKAEVEAKLSEIETLVAPYIRSLDEQQRRKIVKMGEDSVEFVQDAVTAALAKPDVLSRRFDTATFQSAFGTNRDLTPLVPRFEAIARGLDDAEMWAGSVAYSSALEVYGDFSKEVGQDSSLKPYVDAMARRFEKQRGPRTPKA